jgi:hypothetical protein
MAHEDKKPKRGERTEKHRSSKQMKEMGAMMHSKVSSAAKKKTSRKS